MVSFLALLPRSLTTFLYAVAALLRFYGKIDTTPIPLIPLTILQWSFIAFGLGTAALPANLGLEWNAGNRERDRAAREKEQAASRARIQNRFFLLQTRHQLAPSPDTQATLADFLSFFQEYGE